MNIDGNRSGRDSSTGRLSFFILFIVKFFFMVKFFFIATKIHLNTNRNIGLHTHIYFLNKTVL